MTLANDTAAAVREVDFALIPGATATFSSTTGAVSASDGRMKFAPVFAPGTRRTVAFEVDGRPPPNLSRFIRANDLYIGGETEPLFPQVDGRTHVTMCVHAPDGWVVARPGDATSPTCGEWEGLPWAIIAARKGAVVVRDDRFSVALDPEHADAGPAVLAELRAITLAMEERFGPGGTKTIEVVQVDFDSAYSMCGVIALHPGVAPSIAKDGGESPYLAHEIGHQWFGSRASGPEPYREGLPELMALDQARKQGRGEARVQSLIAREARARPGLTIREVQGTEPWPDHDGVAYARAALVWDLLRRRIGEDRFDQLVRRYLDTYAARSGTLDDFLEPLAQIAPDFDRKAFIADTIDSDWDPATGAPRDVPPILLAKPFLAIAGVTMLVALVVGWRGGRRSMLLVDALLALAAAYVVRQQGWIWGLAAAAGLALVLLSCAAGRRPKLAYASGLGWAVIVATTIFAAP